MNKKKLFQFKEFTGIGTPKLDKEQGILTGVKILGLESKNGRIYKHDALVGARSLYEGIKVNVNHPSEDSSGPRDARDRFGKFQEIKVEKDGLYGDLHFLTSHPMAPLIIEAAERMPDVLGFSHNATGRGIKGPSGLTVEEIVKVISVDLVADPATNASLFESEIKETETETETETDLIEDTGKEDELKIDEITLEQLKTGNPGLIKALEAEQASSKEAKELKEETAKLKKENDEFKAKEALQKASDAITEELKEAKLPEQLVTDTFKETLLRCKDKEQRKELIKERQDMAKGVTFKKKKATSKTLPESSSPEDDNSDDSDDYSHLEEANYNKILTALTGSFPTKKGT
jgi:hypothetical protein